MKVKVTIIGKVHDVGYRPFLIELADSLFIERFDARNVHVGGKQAVVVLLEGDKSQVEEFIRMVKSEKPEEAVVEEVRVEDYDGPVRSIDSYRNSLMVQQLNKMVKIGIQMLKKQDEMLKRQDEMLRKQDEMLKRQDEMLKKQDEMLRKQEETIGKIEESAKTICEKIDESTKTICSKIDESTKTICGKIDESTSKICGKIEELRSDLKSYLDEKLRKLEEEIIAIKAKLGML